MAAGDVIYWDDVAYAIDPPVCRLVQPLSQSLTNGTPAAIAYNSGSEEIDDLGFHDTAVNSTRITPTVAGRYEVKVSLAVAASTALTIIATYVAKNGSTVQPYVRHKPAATNTVCVVTAAAIVEVNGSSDYLEHFGVQSSGGALSTQAGGGINSTFEVRRIGPL